MQFVCLHSVSSHGTAHFRNGANQSKKSPVYVLGCTCYWICVPVQSGMGSNIDSLSLFSSSEYVFLIKKKKKKKNTSCECQQQWFKRKKETNKCLSFLSVLQVWVLWRTGLGATTTTSASTAPTASMADVSSCASSSWLLWRMTLPSTTSRCSAGKRVYSTLSITLIVLIMYFFKQYVLVSHMASGQMCRWNAAFRKALQNKHTLPF